MIILIPILHFLMGLAFIFLGFLALAKKEFVWQKVFRITKKRSKIFEFAMWYAYLSPIIGFLGVGILFILAAFGVIPPFFFLS